MISHLVAQFPDQHLFGGVISKWVLHYLASVKEFAIDFPRLSISASMNISPNHPHHEWLYEAAFISLILKNRDFDGESAISIGASSVQE